MTKRYHVKTPEQLIELNAFSKDGSAENIAKVWTIKLRKDGTSPWDNAIFAIFDTSNGRKAFIGRKSGAAMLVNVSLKYNPALQWCEKNLEQVVNSEF